MSAAGDVLIVGAGPTGLMLANQLARRGVRPIVIDRHPGPSVETRALGVHARTLEIYAAMGLADEALALGRVAGAAHLWSNGEHGARVPFDQIGAGLSRFPFILILGQDDNEAMLGRSLARHGIDVRWRTELIAFDEDASQIRATLRLPDGRTETVAAAWIAGCDGAKSAVRRLAGIGFPGAPYEHVFFVADVEARGPMAENELNIYLWPSGFHLFFPMRGDDHWRIVGILPEPLRDGREVAFGDVEPALRAEVGGGLEARRCTWFSTYRIQHRRADRFRAGRAFVLGDAAHIHSPVGAQGMNTGLQDAYNLAWKLALVVQGRADPVLLDSYAAEREPVAERLLATTDRAFNVVISPSRWARLLRTKVLARIAATVMRSRRARRLAFLTVSQTGIAYPDSPLSEALPDAPDDGPRAGDRFPWLRTRDGGDVFERVDDTRFTLLLVGQDGSVDAGDSGVLRLDAMVDAAELQRAGIASPSFWLLRPDGHVGLCGGAFDRAAVDRHLASRVRWRAASR